MHLHAIRTRPLVRCLGGNPLALPVLLRPHQIVHRALTRVASPLVENAHDLPECPYLPGSSLHLTFPLSFLQSSSPSVSVEVVQPFLPFTRSQAIKVRLVSSSSIVDLPEIFLLKLFDRRFVERPTVPGPWSPVGEAQLHNRINTQLSTGGHVLGVRNYRGDNNKLAVEPFIDPDFWDSVASFKVAWSDWEPWEREVGMYEEMLDSLQREAAIYARLSPLQGIIIPRMYGTASCVLRCGTPGDDMVSCVPGLALEYIDGLTLRDLHVGKNISEEEAECVSQCVLSSFRELRKFKVLHGDVRRANIIIRHADRRPFLIDFGSSRDCTDESEEEWQNIAWGLHDIRDARDRLWEQGLHLPSPLVSEPCSETNGFRSLNHKIEKWHDEKWRRKYVEPIEVGGPLFEIRIDADGRQYEWEFPRWKFKPGVNTHGWEDE